MRGGEKPPDPLCWDRTLNKGGQGSLALGSLTRRALGKPLPTMIQMPVLGVPAANGAAVTCGGRPARRPCSHQLHAHVGEHHVSSTAPRSPERVPHPTEEGDWMRGQRGVWVAGGGETGEDGHRCREGEGSGQDGRVEEVSVWGVHAQERREGLGWGHGEGVEGQGTDAWVGGQPGAGVSRGQLDGGREHRGAASHHVGEQSRAGQEARPPGASRCTRPSPGRAPGICTLGHR